MVKVSELVIDSSQQDLWDSSLRVNDPLVYGSLSVHRGYLSKYKRAKVTTKSLLPEIKALWQSLTTDDKNAWKSAAAMSGYSAYSLFVQDTAFRIKYGYSGLATPNDIYQYKVGKILIESPATETILAQWHPIEYYRRRKVKGTKALYENIRIIEQLSLPLQVGLSYMSNLVAAGDNPQVKFYAEIKSHYQGRDIETQVGFDIPLEMGWTRQIVTSTEVLGVARSYSLWISLTDVRGEFFFDNIRAYHTGTNYARDYRCSDVNNELTKTNYQIEKSWEEQSLPNGAAFDSVYFDPS